MRIGIDLNASHSIGTAIRLANSRARCAMFVRSVLLIALATGCNAVVNFGDFEFGPHAGDKKDAGMPDSGATDGSVIEPGSDGSVTPEKDSGDGEPGDADVVLEDASTDAGTDAGIDAGEISDAGHDAGGNEQDGAIMSCPRVAEVCDNAMDDDCDRLADCDDSDCAGLLTCCAMTPETTDERCRDHVDNDCDGKADCDDTGCAGAINCCVLSGSEDNPSECTDGLDNDCDGKSDCADANCAGLGACCAIVTDIGEAGIGTGCCSPDGLSEDDAPNDGKDNDCDGLTDIPQLLSAFPTEGLPSSGAEVSLNFMQEIDAGATLECSTTRTGGTPAFGPCLMSGTTVKVFSTIASQNATNDGLWVTQVRWKFPSGSTSERFTFRYYIHHTLHGVSHCLQQHSDSQFFTRAATRLYDSSTPSRTTLSNEVFKLGLDTFITSPFIQLKYHAPISSRTEFMLTGQTPSIEMYSLRRRFTISPNNRYLLITRNYRGTRSPTCNAATFRIHTSLSGGENTFLKISCQAVVLNRAGMGVCMTNATTSVMPPVFQMDSGDDYAEAIGWPKANKFMWRQLLDNTPPPGPKLDDYDDYSTWYRNFTSKCTGPCKDKDTFLPDRVHFSP
jgi:hypothetical protein